jgi:hypothetical protein
MKKILIILILSVAMVSCYEDYIKDFDYSAIYFPNPVDVRTVVVGEGLKVNLGAALGGVMENLIDRKVDFKIDNSLITPALLASMKSSTYAFIKNSVSKVTELQPLPASYYTLSNPNQIIIKKGWHTGTVTLKVDSTAFLSDPETINAKYILSLYINSADADSLIEAYRSLKVGIKYEHMLFGNYLHGGVTTVKDASGATIQTIPYYTTRSQGDTKIWQLTTISPNTLVTNGYSDKTSTSKKELKLTLNGTNVIISSADGSSNTYEANGSNTFNGAKLIQDRKILLNYKYTVGTDTYECQDTLTFRNRFRDGVNEWQDENPSHY